MYRSGRAGWAVDLYSPPHTVGVWNFPMLIVTIWIYTRVAHK